MLQAWRIVTKYKYLKASSKDRFMSIEHAERLKKELTDQWVVVASGVPELRRFEQFTGQVRTVNMNCRALVEFKGSEDIGWYDIDPQYLTVVDAPQPGKKAAETKKEAAAKPKAAPAKPAPSGGSPLDQIRAQGGGTTAPTKPAAAKPSGGSPLDQIRAQTGGASPAKPSAGKPAAAKPAGGSPLDQIRAQAAGGSTAAAPAEKTKAPEADAKPAPDAKSTVDTSGMSPLDAIRAQGAFKGDK